LPTTPGFSTERQEATWMLIFVQQFQHERSEIAGFLFWQLIHAFKPPKHPKDIVLPYYFVSKI